MQLCQCISIKGNGGQVIIARSLLWTNDNISYAYLARLHSLRRLFRVDLAI